MANAFFSKGKEGLIDGSIDLDTNTIKAVLVDSADYTLALATHDNLDDIAAGARVATSDALASKTVTGGVFDAADTVIADVTGDVFEYIILYKDTGVESTSRLICCFDTATGIPCTPTGGNITIAWSSGASKIFAIV